VGGHHAHSPPPPRSQIRDRAGHSGGLLPRGEGRFAIWSANGGSPAYPNWYYNLKAHPKIAVDVGAETFTVLARELDDTARAELWPKLVAEWPKLVAEWPKPTAGSPDLGAAQASTTRQFPVFILTRQD
jgi:deazaflavin-dependent oxidoreductase (nitroreductase family)